MCFCVGLNSEIITVESAKRDAEDVPADVLHHAFIIKHSDNDQRVFSGTPTSDAGYLIVRLNMVDYPELDVTLTPSEWITLQGLYGRREMDAMVKSLREMHEVILYSENL